MTRSSGIRYWNFHINLNKSNIFSTCTQINAFFFCKVNVGHKNIFLFVCERRKKIKNKERRKGYGKKERRHRNLRTRHAVIKGDSLKLHKRLLNKLYIITFTGIKILNPIFRYGCWKLRICFSSFV